MLTQGRSHGQRNVPGWIHLALPFSHEEIGQILGTCREVITSCLNQFKQKGMIQYRRRSFMIREQLLEDFPRG
ncbi:MAG: winged helix-turn-helix domain-containing protein [Acidobacteria bacterium]|nr:winged helix-turn-helix domain-containing protein [Acidobacteriota bacterium]